MTTIAANLEGMAADSFISDGNPASKIIRAPGPTLIGFCGELYYADLVARWVAGGMNGQCPPWDENFDDKDSKAHESEMLILNRKGLWRMDGRGHKVRIARSYAAMGTGGKAALAALYFGHTPEEAVEAACADDEASKPPIIYEPLRKRKP